MTSLSLPVAMAQRVLIPGGDMEAAVADALVRNISFGTLYTCISNAKTIIM